MDNEYKKEVGQRVKTQREKRGLSIDDLAQHLSLSRHTITKYEQGQRMPDLKVLRELTLKLETTSDYILGITQT